MLQFVFGRAASHVGHVQENEVLVAGKGLARGYLGLEEVGATPGAGVEVVPRTSPPICSASETLQLERLSDLKKDRSPGGLLH